MDREAADLSATEHIRQSQDWSGGTGHLLNLWSAATRQALYPDIDQRITARLTPKQAVPARACPGRYCTRSCANTSWPGTTSAQLIDQITAAPMDGARSISSVLHGRLQQPAPARTGDDMTWAQRTPQDAPPIAHELAAGLDERGRELGEQLAAHPEPWLTRHLGVLAPDASPALREEYAHRSGTAAAYREAPGSPTLIRR